MGLLERLKKIYPQVMKQPTISQDALTTDAQHIIFEFMLNRLRLLQPLTAKEFVDSTGLPWSMVQDKLSAHQQLQSVQFISA